MIQKGELLAPIRQYFLDRLKEIDPHFKENKKTFSDDKVPKVVPKTFQIFLGNLTSGAVRNRLSFDSISVVVKIYFDSQHGNIDSFNLAYEQVLKFKQACVRVENSGNQNFMKGISSSSIRPNDFHAHDKTYFIECEFAVECVFSTGLDDVNT